MSDVKVSVPVGVTRSQTFPKIELHVHLEGTVRAATLLQIARRNGVPLPADTSRGWPACMSSATSRISSRCGR